MPTAPLGTGLVAFRGQISFEINEQLELALFASLGGLLMSEDKNKKLKRIIGAFVVSMVGCAALGLIIELVMTQMYGKYAFTKGPSRPIFAMVWIGVAFWGVFSLIYLCTLPSRLRQQRAYEQMLLQQEQFFEQMRSLAGDGVPAKEFLAVYDALRQSDFTGIYVLHNISKDMFYVGQSVRVVARVGQHLTGHGNGDVYADFKYGDEFEVSTVSLVDSGYDSLNDLERETIAAYDAYNSGYNKTAGNAR